jgi:hypothetical protein
MYTSNSVPNRRLRPLAPYFESELDQKRPLLVSSTRRQSQSTKGPFLEIESYLLGVMAFYLLPLLPALTTFSGLWDLQGLRKRRKQPRHWYNDCDRRTNQKSPKRFTKNIREKKIRQPTVSPRLAAPNPPVIQRCTQSPAKSSTICANSRTSAHARRGIRHQTMAQYHTGATGAGNEEA